MKQFTLGIIIGAALFVLVAATSNHINFITQVFSPGTSANGRIAGVQANGNNAWLNVGSNLSIDASGNLNAAAQSINFAAGVNLTPAPNGILTAFTLPSLPKGNVTAYVNGQMLDPSQFSVSGTTITFLVPPIQTDNLQATYLF